MKKHQFWDKWCVPSEERIDPLYQIYKEGEISFCNCHSTEQEGHTLSCVLEQKRRKDAAKAATLAEFDKHKEIVAYDAWIKDNGFDTCVFPHCNCEEMCPPCAKEEY